MSAATWAKRVSMAVVGSTVLTLGTVNISQAQTTQGFEPPAPGTFVPNTGGLRFTGLTSASSGGNGVALSSRTASVTGDPNGTIFEFFRVDFGRTSASAGNLSIRVQAFNGATELYNQTVNLFSSGLTTFVAPTGQTQVTQVRFTSFISAAPAAAVAPDSFLLASDSISTFSYDSYGYGYEYEDDGYYGGGYGGGYGDDFCILNEAGTKCKPPGRKSFTVDNLSYGAVPEPASILGLLVASGGMAALKRKMGKKTAKKDETLV